MPDLTPDELAAVIRVLRDAIEADRFHLSDRVKTIKRALAKLEGKPVGPKPLPGVQGRTPQPSPVGGRRR